MTLSLADYLELYQRMIEKESPRTHAIAIAQEEIRSVFFVYSDRWWSLIVVLLRARQNASAKNWFVDVL